MEDVAQPSELAYGTQKIVRQAQGIMKHAQETIAENGKRREDKRKRDQKKETAYLKVAMHEVMQEDVLSRSSR